MVDMVLLGAGASAEAGVPMAYEMTKCVLRYYDSKYDKGQGNVTYAYCAQLLRNVIGALIHEKATRGENPTTARVDIEELVSTLRALAREPLGLLCALRDAVMADDRGPDGDDAVLMRKFSDQVRALSDPTVREQSLLSRTLEFIWEYLDTVLWVDNGKAAYLQPLEELAKRQQEDGLVIASLNYDTAVEALFRDGDIPCRTNEYVWRDTGEFPVNGKDVTLLKLHGSIKWNYSNAYWPESQVSRETVMPRTRPKNPSGSRISRPTIAFGADSKLRPTGPFLDLLFAYKQALLKRADRLIIIGYSFRDEHVNEPIRFWFNSCPSRKLIVVDPHFPKDCEVRGEFTLKLKDQLARLEKEQEERHEKPDEKRVHILRKRAGEALAYLAENRFQVG